MPEDKDPKVTPSLLGIPGSASAEEPARAPAEGDGMQPAAEHVSVAMAALEEIAGIAARAWATDTEREFALVVISEKALAALAAMRER